MCILFFYFTEDPKYPYKLILASNRDEFYHRKAQPADFWQDDPHILGGMDMEPGREGGTWLGISKRGKLGALLNVLHKPGEARVRGRGLLVVDFLKRDVQGEEYLNGLLSVANEFGFFHIVLFEIVDEVMKVHHLSNAEPFDKTETLKPGSHAYSNSFKHCSFNKLTKGKLIFQNIIRGIETNDTSLKEEKKMQLTEDLLTFLSNEESHFPDEQMQKQGAGFSEEDLKRLSSIFVKNNRQNYGTRTQTIILIDKNNEVYYTENDAGFPIDPENITWNKVTKVFTLGNS